MNLIMSLWEAHHGRIYFDKFRAAIWECKTTSEIACCCSRIKANATPILLHLKKHFPHFHTDCHTSLPQPASSPLPVQNKNKVNQTYKQKTATKHVRDTFPLLKQKGNMVPTRWWVFLVAPENHLSWNKLCGLLIFDQLLLPMLIKKDLHEAVLHVSFVIVSLPGKCWQLCSPPSCWLWTCF